MSRLINVLAVAALAATLTAGTAAAQQTPAPKEHPKTSVKSNANAEPSTQSTWDQTKTMTRREWNAAKKKWAMEKDKWQDCRHQARHEKLTAPKSWSYIAGCMTKS